MTKKLLILSGILIVLAVGGSLLLMRLRTGEDRATPDSEAPWAAKTAVRPAQVETVPSPGASQPQMEPREALEAFQEWLAAIAKKDGTRAGEIAQALSRLLHKESRSNAEIYLRIRQMLGDSSVSMDAKMELIQILSRAATPQAVALFLEMTKANLPENLKQWIINALSETGEYWWDKASYPEITSMLLQAWGDARNPELLRALTTAIARVGDLRGINQLFDAILGQGQTLAQIQQSRDARVQAALSALANVRNPDLVSAIAGRLTAGNSEAEEAVCAGILASIQNVEATRALLEWAQNADSSSTALIHNAFSRIWDSDCLAYLTSTVPLTRFRSGQVQSAVLESINKS
ncbi:MAG: hypothetical protein QUT30_17660 [Acidobacteriota bacterium]|nr:hypothetical protein [Acidobacteriota bacterium]